MQTLTTILLILGAGLILWFTYRTIKGQPQAFSSANMSKSFFTVGILALLLIGLIAVLVLLLRSS